MSCFGHKRIPKHLIIHDPASRKKALGIPWLVLAAAILIASMMLSCYSRADELINNVKAGQLILENGNTTVPSLHLHSEVDVQLNGMLAYVTLTQTFQNHTNDWQEGIYVFPLPENAAVNHMQMQIGERIIVGEVKEKHEAKKIYNEAQRAGKRAALTEQQRPNLFTQKVANIDPQQAVKVTLRYIHNVRYEHCKFSWRMPMTITPRYIPGSPLNEDENNYELEVPTETTALDINPFGWSLPTNKVPDAHLITPFMVYSSPQTLINPIRINIQLNSGLPLAKIDSPYHAIAVNKQDDVHTISLSEIEVAMDRDFELVWIPVASQQPQAAVFTEQIGDEHYALLMMLPPQHKNQHRTLARDMVFIIDTSGSMQGVSITQAKASLNLALAQLKPQDRFNIIEFNSHHRLLYRDLQPADQINIDHALNWVSQLQANGGTEMFGALDTAMQLFDESATLQQIVFITDGAVGNETELFALIKRGLNNARLFTVGIGSAPNSYFMRKSAQFGRGTFTHIGDTNQVSTKMHELFSKLESAVVSNIDIRWPDTAIVYPNKIPDLYLSEPLLVSAKISNTPGDIEINGTTADIPWRKHLPLEFSRSLPGIGTFWARSKIEDLEDQKITGGDHAELKNSIINVALTHKLMSSHTSFVAVEQTIARPQNAQLNQQGIANLVAHGQKVATQMLQQNSVMYPATATTAELTLWLGMFGFIILVIVRRLHDDD